MLLRLPPRPRVLLLIRVACFNVTTVFVLTIMHRPLRLVRDVNPVPVGSIVSTKTLAESVCIQGCTTQRQNDATLLKRS